MDVKKETYINTLEKCFGNISKACLSVGVSRTTIYNWMKEDAEFRDRVDNINEYIIDEVENHLFDQIKEGSTAATIFYLKTKAKHRGYVEKQEVDHTTNGKELDTSTKIIFK